MLSFRFILNILFSFIIHVLAIEARRIIRSVKCRQGQYYSLPAENCISCHVPCDNAIMKKTQDVCNNFCPDFAKSQEQTSEVKKPSVQSDMYWVAGPVAAGFLTLTSVILVVIYCQKHRRSRKRKHEDPVHEQELQTLNSPQGLDTFTNIPRVGTVSLDGSQLVSVQHNPENTFYPSRQNSAPYIPASDHPSRTLYHSPPSKSLPNHSHHSNEFCSSASEDFHHSTSSDQHNDPVRGPIPYTTEQDDGMIKDESDITEVKAIVESHAAQNGMNLAMLSTESECLQNDNSFITELHCSRYENSTRSLTEEQESLVRAEVSSMSQVSYNRNIPSVPEHNVCLTTFVNLPRNTFHNVAMEHSVLAHTSISIPAIVEHPEGDPDNLEWQEQKYRAAQDNINLHQSVSGINQYNEKEFSMDNPKLFSSICDY